MSNFKMKEREEEREEERKRGRTMVLTLMMSTGIPSRSLPRTNTAFFGNENFDKSWLFAV